MQKMTHYRDIKPNLPNKPVISFQREEIYDDYQRKPDENDEGFWPSQDKNSPGYVGDIPKEEFLKQAGAAVARMAAWENGDWNYIGIRAKATIKLPIGQGSIITYTLESAGLWGVESDADEEYKNEIFEEQKAELLSHIKQFSQCEVV